MTNIMKDTLELALLKPGDIFSVNEERKYMVLKQCQGQTHVISVDLMADNVRFEAFLPQFDYKSSDVNSYIMTNILPLVEEDFGEDIVEHEVDLTTLDMQKDYGTYRCKVRLITFDEAREFNNLLVNKNLSDSYWTCTPWTIKERGYGDEIVTVSPYGVFGWCDCNGCSGVRPFFILNSKVFVTKINF